MATYFTEVEIPSSVTLFRDGDNALLDPFSWRARINENYNGTEFNRSYELWLWLVQGSNTEKIGEIDTDTEWHIEDWNGEPIWEDGYTETDSSQIVNSNLNEPGGIQPGKAQLAVGERTNTIAEVDVYAQYPTYRDVSVKIGNTTVSEQSARVDYTIENPLTRGVPVKIDTKVVNSITGEVEAQKTVEENATGVINTGSVERTLIATQFNLDNKDDMDALVCADLVEVDGNEVS